MILEENIVKKFLNDKASTSIITRVNKLKKLSDFSNYEEVNVVLVLPKDKLEELKIYKDVALEIAKISVHLFVDFNYYSRFCFKGKYNNSLFVKRLKLLGYKNDNEIWKYPLQSKPERSVVLDNIFLHHIINELLTLNSKDNRVNDQSDDENKSSDIDNNSNTTPTSSNAAVRHVNNNKIENERINDNKKQLSLRENKFRKEDNSSNLRESWICKRCTYINGSNISNCETCFASNILENENFPTNTQSEHPRDDIKSYKETKISVPEPIVESNSLISLKSNPIDENSENSSLIHENGKGIDLKNQFKNSIDENSENSSLIHENGNEIDLKNQFKNSIDESIGTNETTYECFKCQELINKKRLSLCDNCSERYFICPNEACTKINKGNSKYCKKCRVKNDSDLKYGNSFRVKRIFGEKYKWQCGFCFTIISEKEIKCIKCGNTRESFNSR